VNESVDPHLWLGLLGLLALVLVGALGLIIALALGWNSPRPNRSPDWEAPAPPLRLDAALDTTVVTLMGCPVDDFTFESEAVPLSGPDFNGYGLVYRAQDAAHYYAFAIGADGYYAVLRVAGDDQQPLVNWQQFPHVHRGRQPNRLRVTCAGPVCSLYINDEYAATVEDDAWLAGDVGLWLRAFGEGRVAVEFANARVWLEG